MNTHKIDKIATFLILSIGWIAITSCHENFKKTEAMNTTNHFIFPKGEQGSSNWFTGTVWVTPLVSKTETINYVVGDVKFEPKARTFWHTHPAEQILLITEGNGFYQEMGKPAKPLKKGDIITIPPNIQHWHGASPNNMMIHIAITNYKEDKNVDWLQPVTDKEYNEAVK